MEKLKYLVSKTAFNRRKLPKIRSTNNNGYLDAYESLKINLVIGTSLMDSYNGLMPFSPLYN